MTQYISPDFMAVLVIHPQRIGDSTLAKELKSALPPSLTSSDPATTVTTMLKGQKNLPKGMDVDKLASLLKGKTVRRVVLLIDSTLSSPTPNANSFETAVIVQFSDEIDGEGIFSAYTTEWQPAETNGVKYRKFTSDGPVRFEGAALSPDNRTLIMGNPGTVIKMLAKNEGERPLLKQLQKASLKHDILVEFAAEPMWAGVTKSLGKSQDDLLNWEGSKMVAPVYKDIKGVSLQINFSGDSLLHGEVTTGKPETAAQLKLMGQSYLGTAKQQYEDLKKPPPPGVKRSDVGNMLQAMPVFLKLGDEIFAGLSIKSEGPQVVVDLPTPKSLPEVLKAAANLAPMMIPGASPAPGPGAPCAK